MNRRILVVCLIFTALFVAHKGWSHWFAIHDDRPHVAFAEARSRAGEEIMIDRRLDVGAGGSLATHVGDADIEVETSSGSEVHVQVILEGRNMDRARQYFEAQRFSVEHEGRSVLIKTDAEQNWRRSFGDNGGAHIRVRVHLPTQFDVSLTTSDGDIRMSDLQGRVAIRTSDGDVSTGNLTGPTIALKTSDGDIQAGALQSNDIALVTSDGDIRVATAEGNNILLQTSDGSIKADQLRGRIAVSTSDGNIQMGRLNGPAVNLKTSDGDIRAEAISAEQASVSTSDGNIRLPHVDGSLRATTSSGEIEIFLLKPGDVQLHTTDGNIRLSSPHSIPASVRLKGEEVKIASGFAFEGEVRPDEIDGTINGGGPRVVAVASSGSVVWEQRD